MNWPRWSLIGEDVALARYVLPDRVQQLTGSPGRSGAGVRERLGEVYGRLAGLGVEYAYEAPSDDRGRQVIRPPDQVLRTPRHGTCLDLAVVLAAAGAGAGLHPILIVLHPAEPAGAGHALVGFWIGEDEHYPDTPDRGWWPEPPAHLADLLARDLADTAGSLLVVDPVGFSVPLPGTIVPGAGVDLATAVKAGHRHVTGRPWRLGLDVTVHRHDPYDPGSGPEDPPLRAPYSALTGEHDSALQLVRAEYGLVPFQRRDEFTVLQDLCRRTLGTGQTGLPVVTGAGGAGKTRLALELAKVMAGEGWYTGVLRPDAAEPDVAWLGSVVAPTLIVVDYADANVEAAKRVLQAVRRRRDSPAVVLLTARSFDGDWLTEITTALRDDGHLTAPRPLTLPDHHPNGAGVFRRAYTALGGANVNEVDLAALPQPSAARWTTLDYVLLGWFAAQEQGRLPTSQEDLYDRVLQHEERYWAKTWRGINPSVQPPADLLRRGAACLTLLTPAPNGVRAALLPLAGDAGPDRRYDIGRTLTACLRPRAGERLAIRPDPVGDHLLLRETAADAALLDACLGTLTAEDDTIRALATFNRAGDRNQPLASQQLADHLRAHPDRWLLVLNVAAVLGGAALDALIHLATSPDTPLPLDDLSGAIPHQHTGLATLAVHVDTARLHNARTNTTTPQRRSHLLGLLGLRLAATGDRTGALTCITEAVEIRRELAQANPAAFLPDLAMSLNNLSLQQSDAGDRADALTSITESVELHRQLAQANPAAFLPNLATSLNNLSVQQSGAGNRAGALTSITEAVELHRKLAQANPAAFLPDLAGSLNNLSVQQSEAGDRASALTSITEAVEIRRELAQANPAAFLPDLATSLNNLSNHQSGAGDRAGALTSITEAVELDRKLAQASPAAFLPNLAMSLNNLSLQQSQAGDRASALTSITEAVELHRKLAQANPAAFLPDLAMSLNNLSNRQSEAGDRAGALTSITESGELYRQLAQASPAAFLPDLAMSLNNLSNRQSEAGDRTSALTSITEAVEIRRDLAQANPAAFLADLAGSLNNLSVQQSEAGDRAGALTSIIEAVEIRRELAQASPAAFLPDLATSLNNLSNRQSGAGDRAGALTSITEAVELHRKLAQANPAAFLPNLAMSLNNLSNRQSQAGDRAGALTSITEAVELHRKLAQANPAAFLPDLAMSLNNLSNRQSGAGNRAGALTSITESVELHRQLAQANPAAFLPNLATSLSNLSNQQGGAGDRAGALTSITESVELHRKLAQANPAAFLPDLAMSLNNLSLQQSSAGNRAGALTSITESVELYRQLAQANPAAFLPDLAMSLNNLSNQQSSAGNRAGALMSVTRSVEVYRELTQASPAAFLPDLAGSLNNLSVRQSEAGDRAGALTSITEAVEIRRELAQANPAAFLPDLTMSLNNNGELLLGDEDAAGMRQLWQHTIASLSSNAAQAELTAHYAMFLHRHDQPGQAAQALLNAAQLADTSAARRTVRQAAEQIGNHDPDLPDWATAQLPPAHLELLDTWHEHLGDWAATEAFLRTHADRLRDPAVRRVLETLRHFTDNPGLLDHQVAVLDAIGRHGLDHVIAELAARHHQQHLLDTWVAAPTWDVSKQFLARHVGELCTDEVIDDLAGIDDEVAQQHAAILTLVSHRGVVELDDIYEYAADPQTALLAATHAIEAGDLLTLGLLTAIAPAIAPHPLIECVLSLAADDLETARAHAQAYAGSADETQRSAAAIRLRSLGRHLPDLDAAATELAAIITQQ